MSDTDDWVLLPDEDSGDKPMMGRPHKRKLTVSHVNKKLEDYHGEIKSEQRTLIEWILREKHQRELRHIEKERRSNEQRLQMEKREKEKDRKDTEEWLQRGKR
jgi:hypothetical protein